MGVQEAGVYWPFKSILSGSGIVLTEDTTSIKIATTGAGPGGGDMLISVYATNGAPGTVDKALSAQTVTGVVAHATLADSVPWGGITGAPTIFPTDWTSVANKPAAFPPLPHALSHVTGGADIIPPASLTASGLLPILSGKNTDYIAGDGVWRALGSLPLVCSAGLTLTGPTGLQLNNCNFQVDATGNALTCGIYDSGTNNASFALANGATLLKDASVLSKVAGQKALVEAYYDSSGAQIYSAEVLTTYNPTGRYTFRAGSQLVGVGDLPGDATAYAKAPFWVETQTNGSFAGFGMVSNGFWGCCLGAWKTGLWIATSSNTFVQLTDNSGHIVGGALAAGAAQTNLGYRPVNAAGDTMTGDLTVSKASAQMLAYQDNNNYVRCAGGLGLYIRGGYYPQGGHIVIQATDAAVAGMTFIAQSGYSYSFWAENNGTFFLIRNNDGYAKQLLP